MLKKAWTKLVAVVALGSAFVASAQAGGVTLPDSGVDTGAYVTAAITALGAIIAVVVGGFFAFLLIRKGIKWARGLLG